MAAKPSSEVDPTNPFGGVYPNSTFIGWGIFPGPDPGEPSSAFNCVNTGDYGSFGGNAYICDPPPDVDEIQGHLTSNNWRGTDVKGSSFIPMTRDEQQIDARPHHADPPPDWSGMPRGAEASQHRISMYRICINRHDGFVNWAFLDFTLRDVGLKELCKVKWHRTFDPDLSPTSQEWRNTGDGWMARFKDY